MKQLSLRLWIIIFAFLFYLPCSAQIKNKLSESKLFTEVAEHEKVIAECEQKRREYQMSQFGKVLPRISGHCWEGRPTKIVKPYYPPRAKRLNISGQLKVETIVDEQGMVIYAKAIQGPSLLRESAQRSAYLSTYTPKKSCDNKLIKFRWIITFNFH
jgi:hypothetical protein